MGVIKYVRKYKHPHNIPIGTELRTVFLENQEFPSSIFIFTEVVKEMKNGHVRLKTLSILQC